MQEIRQRVRGGIKILINVKFIHANYQSNSAKKHSQSFNTQASATMK